MLFPRPPSINDIGQYTNTMIYNGQQHCYQTLNAIADVFDGDDIDLVHRRADWTAWLHFLEEETDRRKLAGPTENILTERMRVEMEAVKAKSMLIQADVLDRKQNRIEADLPDWAKLTEHMVQLYKRIDDVAKLLVKLAAK
jgi:hypothetical protein